MALQDLLNLSTQRRKIGLSPERVEAVMPVIRQYTAFWREYPDLFIDFMVRGTRTEPKEGEFQFYFYQRVFLRSVTRFQYVYAVFPRAYSKSFLTVMALMVRCILYPGAHLFVTSGGKEQGASILQSKVEELCRLIPSLGREIDWGRGKTLTGKDKVRYVFKNGSVLDNLAARESTRGQRRHGGVMEECVGIDDQILREVIIPVMAISRRAKDGTTNEAEPLNKSQIYITTAGYKGTFPYDRLIGFLVRMVTQPDRCMVLGGTWRTPVGMGLQSKTFITDQKNEGTYNEASFDREYESKWSGTVEDAFFNGEHFTRNRKLLQPEYEHSGRSAAGAYYVLSVDVGRKGCDSVVCVFKVTPQAQGPAIKSLVNIYTMTDEHMEDQAIKLKKLYYKFKARTIVIDGNGLGIGLIDYMVKSQNDEVGDFLPDFGVENDDEGYYKKYRTANTEYDAMYIIKANAPINTECHTNAQVQLTSGKVKFLIDERTAKDKLMGTQKGQKMKPEERAEYLKPFTLTSILKEEMMNLREENEGINIILKQANRGIRKDKFSAFEYGLYYIKQEEEKKKKKKKFNAKDWALYN